MQLDREVTWLCGHMVCKSCAENLAALKSCPLCRALCTRLDMLNVTRLLDTTYTLFADLVPR